MRSCFAMTEPAPGVGSDPKAVRTKATRVSGGWSITVPRYRLLKSTESTAFVSTRASISSGVQDVVGSSLKRSVG